LVLRSCGLRRSNQNPARVAGMYEAKGTADMYGGHRDEALADYTTVIELEPDDAGHWRRRAQAHTITPTPEPHKRAEDASRAIELDPHHPIGYGHRAIALTQLPTPDWQQALADMNRDIELFPKHDPKRTGYGSGFTKTWGTTPKPTGTAGWPSSHVAGNRGLNRTTLVIPKPDTQTAETTPTVDWPTPGLTRDRPDPVGFVSPDAVREIRLSDCRSLYSIYAVQTCPARWASVGLSRNCPTSGRKRGRFPLVDTVNKREPPCY